MTYQSCLNELETLLGGTAGVTKVVRADEKMTSTNLFSTFTVTEADCPALVLTRGRSVEEPFAAYPHGIRQRNTSFEVGAFFYSANPATDADTYAAFLEAAQQIVRNNPNLAGAADTTTTFVLTALLGDCSANPRPYATAGRGKVLFHDVFTVQVREGTRAA